MRRGRSSVVSRVRRVRVPYEAPGPLPPGAKATKGEAGTARVVGHGGQPVSKSGGEGSTPSRPAVQGVCIGMRNCPASSSCEFNSRHLHHARVPRRTPSSVRRSSEFNSRRGLCMPARQGGDGPFVWALDAFDSRSWLSMRPWPNGKAAGFQPVLRGSDSRRSLGTQVKPHGAARRCQRRPGGFDPRHLLCEPTTWWSTSAANGRTAVRFRVGSPYNALVGGGHPEAF